MNLFFFFFMNLRWDCDTPDIRVLVLAVLSGLATAVVSGDLLGRAKWRNYNLKRIIKRIIEDFSDKYSRSDAFCLLMFAYIILALALCAACKSIALVDLTLEVPRSEEKIKKIKNWKEIYYSRINIIEATCACSKSWWYFKTWNEKITITMAISGSLEDWDTRLTIWPWQGRRSSERAMWLTRSLMQIFRTTFICLI